MGLLYKADKKGRMGKKTCVGFRGWGAALARACACGAFFYPGDHPAAGDRPKSASGQAYVAGQHRAEVRTSETQQFGGINIAGGYVISVNIWRCPVIREKCV